MIVYKYFFQKRQCISGDAAIVFSTLFRKSVFNHLNEQGIQAGDSFDSIVEYNCEEGEYYYACYYDISSLSKEFGISRQGMYNIIGFLESEGYIIKNNNEIHILFKSVFSESKYVKIAKGVNLRGWELVTFSYLCHRLSMYNSKAHNIENTIIDTWVSRLQEELCYDEYRTFRRILLRIQQKGYIKLENNFIVIMMEPEESCCNKKKSAKESTLLIKTKRFTALSQGAYDYSLQR